MFYKLNCLLYIITFFIKIKCPLAFNVNFYYNYNLEEAPFNTQIYKRDLLSQTFDRAQFSLNGFEKVESVPVLFPIDICIFNLDGFKYATALHINRNGTIHFKVIKMMQSSYDLIADIATPYGIAMDCLSFNNKGYVAIALNLTQRAKYATEGSPIYEIAGNHLRAVQYFPDPNLISVYLRVSGNEFFLLHSYSNSQDMPHLYCPYFKWSGSSFNKLGRIHCSNARQLAPFSIDYESYVAVANYADQSGRTTTNSEIYKYSRDKKKFLLLQKIETNGAVDVKYFSVPHNQVRRQHFLVFGNSISSASLAKREKAKREGKNLEADSVFYTFEKGLFVPYQKLSLYAVEKFLPVQNELAEKFILLVACTDQDIKIYNLNDWKFEESTVQFTEGALGKGISNMRIYQEQEKSYLIIANELMADNETNIFLPIFKQEEDVNALRQQVIDWSKLQTKRLETINSKELTQQVEDKLRKLKNLSIKPNIPNLQQANIQTVNTESFVYSKLKMTSDYWKALNYISQALSALEVLIKQKQQKQQRLKRETHEDLEYVYDALKVNTLKVNRNLKASRVNGVNAANPVFKLIKAPKVKVNEEYIPPPPRERQSFDYLDESEVMTVRNLQIKGKLNEYQWSDLLNNTLKRQQEIQFVKAPIHLDHLKSDSVVVNSDKVNEQNLATLVPIDGGKYVINQDIQFAKPITANKVEIFDRLNNLHIFNGKFDVLLHKSNKTQVIEGVKNLTHVKVMEPITIAGKMMGRQLEAISPNKFINEPLTLHDNFMIKGDVHVIQQLNSLDLIDLREKVSAKQVLDMGIRMDKSLKDVNLKFLQPIKANNSLISFVNQHDLQRLVKLDHEDIQIMEGTKIFNTSLEIRKGFSEVKNLNGIDMEKLETNAFLKNNNQTIKVPIKFAKLTAKSIESPNLRLNSKNLSDYLSLTGNQSIEGSLIVDNIKAQFLFAEHLNTEGKIFKQNLQDIYQQKSRSAPQEDIFQPNRKFHGSIYVQNLVLNSTINNRTVWQIENQLLQLEGNIKYVGNFKFNYDMSVNNMTFEGKINDIPAQEFGQCWLQKRAEKQVFTTPQTFDSLNALDGIELHNKLNGFTTQEFFTNTYWLNRDEYIENAIFENPIEITSNLTTLTLNNNKIPQDVFHRDFKASPINLSSLTVDGNVTVEGFIHNLTSINSINLFEIQEFLDGSRGDTLYVDNAHFLQTPAWYKTLNGLNLRGTLDSVWLANENVILSQHVEMASAQFEGLLEFEGTINNMNLENLQQNYLSKTKTQEISVEMVLAKGAEFEKDIKVQELQVFGEVVEGKSGNPFNFNEFIQNTLKTSGPHIISGNWSLLEAIVQGNLNDVLINQLKLKDDVVLNVKPSQFYHLHAGKTFKTAHIENLYAEPLSLINQTPLAKWINNAVYLYENFTIKGVTSIDALNVYNNIQVLGNCNNVTFNEFTLLLQKQNQHLTGNVKIISHLAEEQRFLTNNIENLYTDYVNGQHMPTFMDNLVPIAATTEIKSPLTFKHSFKLQKYEGPEGFLTQNHWIKRDIKPQTRFHRESIDEMLEELVKVKNYFRNITKTGIFKLHKFDILQTLSTLSNSTEMVMLSFKFDSVIVDILIAFDKRNRNVEIYEWLPNVNGFRKTKDFDWLPLDPLSLRILKTLSHPIDVNYFKYFVQQDLKTISEIITNSNNLINIFVTSNKTCFNYETVLSASTQFRTYCLNTPYQGKILNFPHKVQQTLILNENSLALLTNSSVLIYNTRSTPAKISQKLSTVEPKQIALASFKRYHFMAILSKGKSNSLNSGYVEIYRSVNSSAFNIFQTFESLQPIKVEFSYIEKSDDYLLHILTDSSTKPYLIFQYQGIMGFQEILTDSILPGNFRNFQIFHLYSSRQYLVALRAKDTITFMEIALKQII